MKLTLERARAAMIAAQGLVRPAGSVAEVLEEAGPLRTLGGVEAYLALRARLERLRAEDVHAAVAAGQARVTSAMRGCMYLAAGSQAPLLAALAGSLARPRLEKERAKAGIEDGELERVGDRVVELLARGPLGTDGLKKALPAGVVRSLGAAGKKVGLSSTLPPALRLLEWEGRIVRGPAGDRLDNERYLWRVVPETVGVPTDPAELLTRAAGLFFRAAGLSTLGAFAAWAGVPLRDARTAIAGLETFELEVDGLDEPRLALVASRPLLEHADAGGVVRLLPFEDNLLALQGSAGALVDAAHHALPVPNWGSDGKSPLGESKHLSLRPVIAEGKLAGFWEWDPVAKEVVTAMLAPVGKAARDAIAAEAAALGRFIAEELGHGRSFSLDTDDALAERAAWVRGLTGKGARAAKTKGRGAPAAKTKGRGARARPSKKKTSAAKSTKKRKT